MRHLILSLTAIILSACGRDTIDWKSVKAELDAAMSAGTTGSEASSRKLEHWMKLLGIPITIDHPEENSLYRFPFIIASHIPDAKIKELQRFAPGAKTREDFVRQHIQQHRVDKVPFDRADWDAARHENPRQRYRLFKGYCGAKSPIGKRREDIEKYLGTNGTARDGMSLFYHLGSDLGLGIDSIGVHLSLEDGKVSGYNFTGD